VTATCVQVVCRVSVTVTVMCPSASVTTRLCSLSDSDVCTGCVSCECNGHGDVSVGVCHNETGVCHCTHHTHGRHCETCDDGFYGDPRSVLLSFNFFSAQQHLCLTRSMLSPVRLSVTPGDQSKPSSPDAVVFAR